MASLGSSILFKGWISHSQPKTLLWSRLKTSSPNSHMFGRWLHHGSIYFQWIHSLMSSVAHAPPWGRVGLEGWVTAEVTWKSVILSLVSFLLLPRLPGTHGWSSCPLPWASSMPFLSWSQPITDWVPSKMCQVNPSLFKFPVMESGQYRH